MKRGMKRFMEKNHQFIATNETLDELSQEFIFHKILKLTENEPQFIPMLMYALYKQDKVKFIVQEKNINVQDEVDKEKLDRFQKLQMNDNKIEEYKNQANRILEDTINILLRQKKHEIEEKEEYLNIKERELKLKEKDLLKQEKDLNKRNINCPKATSFWNGVLQSIIGTFVVYGITILILFNYDINILEELLKKIFNK